MGRYKPWDNDNYEVLYEHGALIKLQIANCIKDMTGVNVIFRESKMIVKCSTAVFNQVELKLY